MPRITGRYERTVVADEEVAAFVPNPLPPSDPPLSLDEATRDLLQQAEQALSRLDLAAEMVPSIDWFIHAFVRKEAVLSSQIEGTQATLVDLQACSATPIVIASLLVLGDAADRLARAAAVPLVALTMQPNSIWPPDECPACANGIALVPHHGS